MDPSPIPINVCKIQETNEKRIEETFNEIHQKFLQVQQESNSMRIEVKKLDHEAAMLEKEEYCLESKNKVLEEEIALLKSQTEEVASTVESLKWKIYKINLIKEYEHKNNEQTYKVIHEEMESSNNTTESGEPRQKQTEKGSKLSVTEMKAKIAHLKEEIEKEKQMIEMTDPKLLTNMKMLEKRNAALLLRYQRQIGDATRRYRQTVAEVNSLKRILSEKNALLADKYDLVTKEN